MTDYQYTKPTPAERRKLMARYTDRSGLFRVVVSTGEVSEAISYEQCGVIIGAMKKRVEFKGARFKIVPV